MDYEKKLFAFFSTCNGKIMNVFYNAYSIINSLEASEQPFAVKYLCENIHSIKSDNTNSIQKEYYSEEQVRRAGEIIEEKFKPVLSAMIELYSKKNIEPIDFYSEAWQVIQSSMFRSKRERALALFALADHDLIPYRNVGIGLSMSNDDYHAIVESLENTVLQDAEYILKLDFEQKTQRASLLLDKLLSLESREAQTVYLAIIMNEVMSNYKEHLKSTLEKL